MAELKKELASRYLIVLAATALAAALPSPFAGYAGSALGLLFLWIAVAEAQKTEGGLERFGLALGGVLDVEPHASGRDRGAVGLVRAIVRALPSGLVELAIALGVCLLVFPPFIWGFRIWHELDAAFSLRLPAHPIDFVLGQLLAVALPEEALFRGYFQTRLGELFTRPVRLLGVELSLGAWIVQAVLFAVLHVASVPSPERLAVFFPGLLFGWLRAWRGGIGAAVFFHAACNVLAELLARGFEARS